MKEVKAFKTTDGEIFETEKEANMHDRECAFKEAHFNDPLQCRNGHPMTESVIMDWLISNKEAVLALYGCSDKPSMVVDVTTKTDHRPIVECIKCADIYCIHSGTLYKTNCGYFKGKDS